MEMLQFHTEEIPMYEAIDARFVVVAFFGEWRDGEATSNPRKIPQLKRELRKRFMNRIAPAQAA
ncbi:MAG: hypothetical protein OEZ16_05680 [Chromatiales bacterium]|nr:hypothetical protein [Chromatiales bacterium]